MDNNLYYLNSLLNNNAEGIDTLYHNVFPKVKRFVIQNKGQEVDAEDIFQKALLQITVRYRRDLFEINSSFEAYLFTACKNLWRRALKKSNLKVTEVVKLEPSIDTRDEALAALEQERWELFNEGLKQISDNCNKILSLYFAKVSYQDIMQRFDYNSESVVRQRVFKCKNKLKQLIQAHNRFNTLKNL
ncbi:MAG: sigma-70 family RNA polymerase sigma factor [Flavobacteriaceae bacterium]|nr:sigma-70 family RNA polymerase sigma factor [Flavobacteriaceae bacterium]